MLAKILGYLTLLMSAIVLLGCGGGSDTKSSARTTQANQDNKQLNGPVIAGSEDLNAKAANHFSYSAEVDNSDGVITSYSWVQESGIKVEIIAPNSDTLNFKAPNITQDEKLVFRLSVVDNSGLDSSRLFTVKLSGLTLLDFDALTDEQLKQCLEDQGVVNTEITSLTCHQYDIASVQDLLFFKNLTELNITDSRIESIASLSQLPDLSVLNLSDNEYLEDINDIAFLKNLVELNLSNTKITSLDDIAQLDKLEYIDLSETKGVISLQPLIGLSEFDTLILSSSTDILCEDIKQLIAKKPNSSIAMPEDCNVQPIDWTLIKDEALKTCILPKQDAFDVIDLVCHQGDLNSLDGIEQFENLQDLLLLNVKFSDFSPLISNIKLASLGISQSDLNVLPELTQLNHLTKLTLTFNNLTSLDGVENLPNLTELTAFNNNISDLSAVSALANLELLKLGGNEISELDDLSMLNSLKRLEVSGNNILSVEPLINLENLDVLHIEANNNLDCASLNELKQLIPAITINYPIQCVGDE